MELPCNEYPAEVDSGQFASYSKVLLKKITSQPC
jgi:hypothetical protein